MKEAGHGSSSSFQDEGRQVQKLLFLVQGCTASKVYGEDMTQIQFILFRNLCSTAMCNQINSQIEDKSSDLRCHQALQRHLLRSPDNKGALCAWLWWDTACEKPVDQPTREEEEKGSKEQVTSQTNQ